MIFPLIWFPYIVFFTWPFLAVMMTSVPGAVAAEAVWLGTLAFWQHRKRVRRGLSRKVHPRP